MQVEAMHIFYLTLDMLSAMLERMNDTLNKLITVHGIVGYILSDINLVLKDTLLPNEKLCFIV